MAETVLNNNNKENQYFVGVRFNESGKSYFFSTSEKLLKIADKVVVETARGLEIGIVSILPQDISSYNFKLELKPVLRIATEEDITKFEENIKLAKESFLICYKEVNNLGLDMNLISCEYTLDRTKVIISYLASERVDFRELLKVLAAKLKCRIELRQIGTRDKAKIIGGIGICGLQLCCTTFLNEFDGISITMAKNQMLALNIPKLSGHCGKLICCLKFENEAYLDAQKDLPSIGLRVRYNDEVYKITSMNVITRMIRLETKENVINVPYDEIKDKVLPKDYAANQQALAQKKKKEQLQEENTASNNIKVEESIKEEVSSQALDNQNNRRNNFKRRNNNYQGKKQNEKN